MSDKICYVNLAVRFSDGGKYLVERLDTNVWMLPKQMGEKILPRLIGFFSRRFSSFVGMWLFRLRQFDFPPSTHPVANDDDNSQNAGDFFRPLDSISD